MANRSILMLICGDCKGKNYSYARNKKGKQYKVEAAKFCPSCRKHTNHKEGKA